MSQYKFTLNGEFFFSLSFSAGKKLHVHNVTAVLYTERSSLELSKLGHLRQTDNLQKLKTFSTKPDNHQKGTNKNLTRRLKKWKKKTEKKTFKRI